MRGAQAVGPARRWLERRYRVVDDRLGQRLLGLEFANPIGLAAGFDKNARAVAGMACLGFGFLEVGTVTPRPQEGNPRPRILRHREQRTLQNWLGFNNEGMERVARSLAAFRPARVPVGVNVGKNRDTPDERVEEDYAALLGRFDGLCDFYVINVSSPNTPGLRDLQRREMLVSLVARGRRRTAAPILIKLAPDLPTRDAVDLAVGAVAAGAAGIVLTNTTTDYDLLPGVRPQGGLSGRVLRRRSFELLQAVAAELFGRTLLISVGGIDSAAEAWARLRAGASLVEVYTALVYRGPGLARELNRGLLELLEREGVGRLTDAIGADVRRPG